MKEFVSHINYLIQKHDCVIIPDFGGFVLNHVGASFATDGSVLPPKVTAGFNPELRYNDGLLAESYMNVYSITYDEAVKRIDESVKRLNTILGMKHPIQIGQLGKLSLNKDNKLLFTPNANLSIFHPETFGLSTLNIRRLADIEKDKTVAKRRSLLKRTFAGIGTAAAAMLVFFFASTPVSENTQTQKSSFFTDWIASATSMPDPTTDQQGATISPTEVSVQQENKIDKAETNEINSITPSIIESSTVEIPTTDDVKPSNIDEVVAPKATGDYFVIVGGATTDSEARNLLKKFKAQGFNDADMVSSSSRIRIYVESFASRSEAEKYLVSFKEKHPQFSDAWVYFKN
ncbi:SPOR domain-containing protein [Dysgonomonas sp. OttesenSCG-928-M03]|nr:SPOR domain-containing protein [Dysgonomonas sp. OttesenSCG-928-M03]